MEEAAHSMSLSLSSVVGHLFQQSEEPLPASPPSPAMLSMSSLASNLPLFQKPGKSGRPKGKTGPGKTGPGKAGTGKVGTGKAGRGEGAANQLAAPGQQAGQEVGQQAGQEVGQQEGTEEKGGKVLESGMLSLSEGMILNQLGPAEMPVHPPEAGVGGVPVTEPLPVPGVSENEEELARQARETKAQLAAWRANPEWIDETPDLKVTVPKGALCELACTFKVGLPPNSVLDILCDPDNKRVFKNIKEMKSRNVIFDDGLRQTVEVEQSAIWRFLCFSGTFDVTLKVLQDRMQKTMDYSMTKEGFMKRFEGNWKIRPIVVPDDDVSVASSSASLSPSASLSSSQSGASLSPPIGSHRIASEVSLRQYLQPGMLPPPPISWYVRGITSNVTRELMQDLQTEAKRIREGKLDERGLERTSSSNSNSSSSSSGRGGEGRGGSGGGGGGGGSDSEGGRSSGLKEREFEKRSRRPPRRSNVMK
eukprot:jgi/Mesen1/7811/ME000413S07062